jgi:hypothetical protein
MEVFRGTGHLPGASEVWDVELSAEWENKEFVVRIPATGSKFTEWPGLMAQTIGNDEAIFRTRGIPPLEIHWWHVVRSASGDLWAMVIALPSEEGIWLNCGLRLEKT